MPNEFAVTDSRERTNQHVLRIAGDGSHASDIRSRCQRQQVSRGLQVKTAGDAQDKWHHHQAHNIVHEKSREKTRSENHRRQQMRRLDAAQHQLRAPFEEANQVQAGHDQHHRKQQNDGREIDELKRLIGRNNAKCNHGHRTDNGRAWAIDFQPLNRDYDQIGTLLDYYRPLKDALGAVDVVSAAAPPSYASPTLSGSRAYVGTNSGITAVSGA